MHPGKTERPAQSGCEPGTNVPHLASVGRYRKIVLRLQTAVVFVECARARRWYLVESNFSSDSAWRLARLARSSNSWSTVTTMRLDEIFLFRNYAPVYDELISQVESHSSPTSFNVI